MSETTLPTTYSPVTTRALWNWNTVSAVPTLVPASGFTIGESPIGGPAGIGGSYVTGPLLEPTIITFSSGAKTKSGLQPNDLRAYIQIPLQQYSNPPIPISDDTIFGWIRDAEDEIETETNIRLCQTAIAAPPAKTQQESQLLGLNTVYNYQQLGLDYDYAEPGYDFFFERARDEGWLYQRLRWRPVKGVDYVDPAGIMSAANLNGTKNVAFIYPLLNEYFRMPQSWVVEDQNRGLVRFVPATSVQMLPLFAMQLAFMGFAENVPQGMWFQYTAGLTRSDYAGSWAFMKQLVLARSAVTALKSMQLSVNFGALETTTQVDGLLFRSRYDPKGAFAGAIEAFSDEVKRLTRRAKTMGGGVHLGIL
jgi:hypothetical protein